jgi:type I restriction enzyme S subunit
MNKIEKLIEELCPEGVSLVKLEEVSDYIRGLTYSKSDEDVFGTVKVLRSNNINFESNTINLGNVKNLRGDVRTSNHQKLFAGDILISAASGSRAHVGKVAHIPEDIDFYFGGFMAVVRTSNLANSKYLFHLLTSKLFRDYLDSAIDSTTINNLNSRIVGSFEIPLPPLPVQTEIVSILDKFTELEAELEAELDARSKQFKYFCDYYFSEKFASDHSHALQPLGSQGSFQKGSGLQKSDFVEAGVPCIHYGQIHTRFGSQTYEAISSIKQELASGLRKAKPGDIVIADTAEDYAGVGKATAWLGPEPIAVGGHTLIYSHQFDPIYLSYFLRSDTFQFQKNRLAKGVKVKDISSSAMGKIVAPVPPLSIQQEIGRNLMALDTLIIDSPGSINAEIKARRQQYEYYRNKLLTFKELKAS